MRVRACDIPQDARYRTALRLAGEGVVTPEEALLFVVCPGTTEVEFEAEDVEEVKLCRNGLHPMTYANTVVRRDGWGRCRECMNAKAKRKRKSHALKAECATCGAVCWPRTKTTVPRCRDCWKSQVRRQA